MVHIAGNLRPHDKTSRVESSPRNNHSSPTMAPYIPPPDSSSLIPPLLACLPTAFVSTRPPPALLPLLSPILRQRVRLLFDHSSQSSGSSWLPLLCWDSKEASELASIVESGTFEPHPVSGEVEFGDVGVAKYRYLDQETLQSKLDLSDMGLLVIYLWCEEDEEGGGRGWRASEIKPFKAHSEEIARPWWTSMIEAKEKSREPTPQLLHGQKSPYKHVTSMETAVQDEGDNDDDYWARYDSTPSRTPGPSIPAASIARQVHGHHIRTTSEDEYFAQYAQVQPEMDNDDPTTKREEIGESSLNGTSVFSPVGTVKNGQDQQTEDPNRHFSDTLVHTRPSSSSSSVVAQLEQTAESHSHAEVAIQQHISTTMKSLYRLARGAGIDKVEFERIIHTELETLSMLDEE